MALQGVLGGVSYHSTPFKMHERTGIPITAASAMDGCEVIACSMAPVRFLVRVLASGQVTYQ